MAYTLPPLPYAADALEPCIDKMTMEIHHDRHHKAYVDNLNKALEGDAALGNKPIEQLLREINQVPEKIRNAVRNNGGGHANHSMFWQIMAPKAGGKPSGPLADDIAKTFGDFGGFQTKLKEAALTRFGSGWGWLVLVRRQAPGHQHRQPGQSVHGRTGADPRHRRLGTRLLPEVPEQARPITSTPGGTWSTGARLPSVFPRPRLVSEGKRAATVRERKDRFLTVAAL